MDLTVVRPSLWLRVQDYILLCDAEGISSPMLWFVKYFMSHHFRAAKSPRITSDIEYTEHLVKSSSHSVPGVSGHYDPTFILVVWLLSRLEHNGTTLLYNQWVELGYSSVLSSILMWLCDQLLWASCESFSHHKILNFDYCTREQLLNHPGSGLTFISKFRYSLDHTRLLMFFRILFRRSFVIDSRMSRSSSSMS